MDKTFGKLKLQCILMGRDFSKKRPLDHARAPKAEEWRQKGEGFSYGCIAKGKKEGSSNINFMVGISFNKDVVLCEQYFGSIATTKFAKTVENKVPRGS